MDVGDRFDQVSPLELACWCEVVGRLHRFRRTSSLYTLALAMRDLENLLFLKKAPPKKSTKKELYEKANYWTYCENRKAAFQKLYMFCFALAKPEFVLFVVLLADLASDT
jgi:hypothetical protein